MVDNALKKIEELIKKVIGSEAVAGDENLVPTLLTDVIYADIASKEAIEAGLKPVVSSGASKALELAVSKYIDDAILAVAVVTRVVRWEEWYPQLVEDNYFEGLAEDENANDLVYASDYGVDQE